MEYLESTQEPSYGVSGEYQSWIVIILDSPHSLYLWDIKGGRGSYKKTGAAQAYLRRRKMRRH